MTYINDQDRTIFAEGSHTVLDNFTDAEHEGIHRAAGELKAILDAAKKRQLATFQKGNLSAKGFSGLK